MLGRVINKLPELSAIVLLLNYIFLKNEKFLYIFFLSFFISLFGKISGICKYIFLAIMVLFIYNKNFVMIFIVLSSFKLLIKFFRVGIKKVNEIIWLMSFNFILYLSTAINLGNISPIITYLSVFIIFYLCLYIEDEEERSIFRFILLINSIILIVFLISNFQNFMSGINRWELYLNGSSGLRSNGIGTLIISFFPFSCMGYFYSRKLVNKIFCILLIILNLSTMLLISSRSTLVTVFLMFVIILIKQRSFKKLILAIIFLLVGWIIFEVFSENSYISLEIVERFSLENKSLNEITSGRANLYIKALEIFKENFLFGIGMYSFGAYIGVNGGFIDVHNFILQFMAETGIFGTIMMGGWIISILIIPFIKIKVSSKNFSIVYVFLLSSLGILIQGLMEPTITVTIPLFLYTLFSGIGFKFYRSDISDERNNFSRWFRDKTISSYKGNVKADDSDI